ncbi:hypothetical protein [Pantoea sp.]|uniref:hypothetical protein n=1 Tax=Pantoea sp. TaxID=69393 RepID=UPI0028AB3874|nr:hypothetical protein [Pantoea sp.]
MGKTSMRLEEFKRDPSGLEDKSKYTVISHSDPDNDRNTIIDWVVELEHRPMIHCFMASIDIKTDLHGTKEEAFEQLGRWMIRLGEALQEHNIK